MTAREKFKIGDRVVLSEKGRRQEVSPVTSGVVTKRPASWQLAKQRTAKAIRALPPCEECVLHGCNKRGLAFAKSGRWLCPTCARAELSHAQRARRERT